MFCNSICVTIDDNDEFNLQKIELSDERRGREGVRERDREAWIECQK